MSIHQGGTLPCGCSEAGPCGQHGPQSREAGGLEALDAKAWGQKEFWPKQPKCAGYDGVCDGDLPGEEHVPTCPMFGKTMVSMWDFANAYGDYRAALSSRQGVELHVVVPGLENPTPAQIAKEIIVRACGDDTSFYWTKLGKQLADSIVAAMRKP